MENIFSELSVSVGELKRNFRGVIKQADIEI